VSNGLRVNDRPAPWRSLRAFGPDLRAAALPWLVARVLVGMTLVLGHGIARYTGPLKPSQLRHLDQGLLGWDAERYLQIATRGYLALPPIELRFFPLVPVITRVLDPVLPGDAGVALLFQANVAALLLGALTHRLVLVETGDDRVARAAAILVALTPASFVLAWGYTEALWGCLTVGTLLSLRTQRWWLAAACGALAGLTRPVAPLLCLPAAIEALRAPRPTSLGGWLPRAAAVGAPVAGVGAYLTWVWVRVGDPLIPYRIQQGPKFRGSLTDPVTPLLHTIGDALSGKLVPGLRIVWAVVLIALVVEACRRWPASYGALAAATLFVALGTQRLGSFERYGFSSIPIVVALAGAVAHKRLAIATAIGAAAMLFYGTHALVGGYTP
jgi:hypothetical protein